MSNSAWLKCLIDELYLKLKSEGYRRRGQMFSRKVGDVIQMIQVQVSRFSIPGRLDIALNIGCYSPSLAGILAESSRYFRVTAAPLTSDAHWKARINQIATPILNDWVEITSLDEAKAAARELSSWLVQYWFPIAEDMRSTRELVDYCMKDTRFVNDAVKQLYASALDRLTNSSANSP